MDEFGVHEVVGQPRERHEGLAWNTITRRPSNPGVNRLVPARRGRTAGNHVTVDGFDQP